MRRAALVAALVTLSVTAACKKTGEGEIQIQTPNVSVTPDSTKLQVPTVEGGTRTDTVITKTPTVSVKTPAERARDSAAAANRKP